MSNEPSPNLTSAKSGTFKTVVAWVCGPIVLLELIATIAIIIWAACVTHNAESSKTYMSMARLLIGGMEVNPKLGNGETMSDAFFGTCAELMMSGELQKRATNRARALRPDLVPLPLKIEAARMPGTRILVIRATAEDPAYVQPMVDAVMDEFITMRKELRPSGQEEVLFAIQDEIVRLEKTMPLAEQKIKAAELSGASPEQLIEPKAALQVMKTNYERLIENLRRIDIPHPGGEVFSILEHASPAVKVVPSFSLFNLFK